MREGEVLKEERISPLNDEMMTEFLRVKAEKAEEEARAEVFIFGVTELKVGAEGMYFRKRPICEPKLNSLIAQNTLIHLTSIEENIKGARKGRVTAQVDFISYYDQIGLEKAVRVFFGVKWKGVYYYLLSLPMGLRVSVLVACAITWFLTSFKRDDVHINTFIDNVRFAGAEEEIIKAVLLFTERARAVGASLDKMPTTEEEARGILESEGDFLGIHFQYSTQRMRLTEKTVEKIRMINAGITVGEDITFKQFAVIMGLYNFATRVLKFQAWEVYHLFRRYREEASKEALFPSTVWGSRPLRLSPKEAEEVRVMEEYFLRNEWVSYAEAPKADVHIFSDACAEGWGGVMVKDGLVTTVKGRWDEAEIAAGVYEASTTSEPEGLRRVWRAFGGEDFRHANIFLDHEGLVWGCKRGRPHSFFYNRAWGEICSSPGKMASVFFCPGVDNPADYPSRGREVPQSVIKGLAELAERLTQEEEDPKPGFMI